MAKLVNEFSEHDHIKEQLMVVSVAKGSKNNGPYIKYELRDSSGAIIGNKWNITPEDEMISQVGNVLNVDGEVISYKDNKQLKIYSLSLVSISEIDTSRFLKMPPISKAELTKKYTAFVESIKDETCHKLLVYFIEKYKNKLYDYPAASSIHHEYSSGLLMHSVSMAELGEFLVNQYPNIDRDLLITAILLHDVGKLIELEGQVVFHYSLEGKLLGHISIMAGEIAAAREKLNITNEKGILLEHMILSHHGALEYGSPILPLTKEALLLSLIDNLDSKMVILNKALEDVKPGEFSQKIFPLDGRMFYKPKK